jgi:diguanylate cyclase (GGDEF)-like protein
VAFTVICAVLTAAVVSYVAIHAERDRVVSLVWLSSLAVALVFGGIARHTAAALMRSIEALSEAARRIAQGDFDHELPDPRTQDDVGLLTRSFNTMVRRLRESRAEVEAANRQLREQNEELQRANEVLGQLSITDGLTKLHNHRYFQDHLTREIKRVSRSGEPLSILLIDLDDFKGLNDRYGHAAGDELLTGVAGLLNASVRETDLVARYGGDEFVVLAPETTLTGAVSLAEKIRMGVERACHSLTDTADPVRVTISCGVAEYRGDRKAFFQSADRALYRAKSEGRNCVVAAD